MSRSACTVALLALAVACAARPSSAFLQDLLLHPLQQIQHAVQPPLQPQLPPQYYQYQYRRAVNDAPPPQPLQQVYSNSRPAALYQWQPSSSSSPSYGNAYSYSANPFASLLQNPWFPWSANRQPQQQQLQQLQHLQSQPLSGGPAPVATQPQQWQQPLQAFWALLPWNSNSNNNNPAAGQQQQQSSGTPVLTFLQNQAALLPWTQQYNSRPGVVYTSPLAPSSPDQLPVNAAAAAAAAAAGAMPPQLQMVAAEVPASVHAAAATAPSAAPVVKHLEEGSFHVEADSLSVPSSADLSSNGLRRLALHPVTHDGLPCA